MSQLNTHPEGNSDFTIESAVLSSNRTSPESTYEISRIISDLTVYEHLDKPYLTGEMLIVDYYNILDKIDFQGGEQLTITIRSLHSPDGSIPIVKTFYVQKIVKSVKVNDQSEAVQLRLVENINFVSSVKNINKSFTGSPVSIVSEIVNVYLNRTVRFPSDSFQSRMKVIVPNMHPLEAAQWIKNRSTNYDGLPYFLFSVLADDDLRMFDLGTMLASQPINIKKPYFHWTSGTQNTLDKRYAVIQSYTHDNNDDLLSLIRKGSVGSRHNFYDTINGNKHKVEFDIDTDGFKQLVDKEYLSGNQTRYTHGSSYTVDNKNISSYNSLEFSQIASTSAYPQYKSLSEEKEGGDYKKRVVGSALKNFMSKTPLTVQVYGRDFIMSEDKNNRHRSIGNVVRILFADPTTDTGDGPKIDKKKSGDYIIYAAKHKFSKERYDTQLLCTKLAAYKEDPSLS